MNNSGCKDPTAETAIGRVEKENKRIRKCKHVERIGDMAVYVNTGCRRANMIKGVLVSSRQRCLRCLKGERYELEKETAGYELG